MIRFLAGVIVGLITGAVAALLWVAREVWEGWR